MIQGRVVRVFRSDGRLDVGDPAGFSIWVCDGPESAPTGFAFIVREALTRATHIEAYLHDAPPNCELAGYEFCVVDGPLEEPALTVDGLRNGLGVSEKDEPLPESMRFDESDAPRPATTPRKRWWRFWKN